MGVEEELPNFSKVDFICSITPIFHISAFPRGHIKLRIWSQLCECRRRFTNSGYRLFGSYSSGAVWCNSTKYGKVQTYTDGNINSGTTVNGKTMLVGVNSFIRNEQ